MEKEYITLITALGAPFLVLIGGLITWFFKSRKEELQAIEERALERRIQTYNTLLHPLIVMFANKSNQKMKDKAITEIGSVEYRKAGFNLITFGSDEMVTAYNNMMQSFYKNESESNPKLTMKKFAQFLLSVRKDVYNKNTKLKEWDMLKFMITDIEKLTD
ncbi:hypothetical protein ABMY20_05835 [Tenacibaculum sp. SSH1-16]|uniref:hypothetical protein n=1 Tax=Tenacibaculum sp. SSH1-16 TaxID=3136667 RepID=UPI0032C3FC1E